MLAAYESIAFWYALLLMTAMKANSGMPSFPAMTSGLMFSPSRKPGATSMIAAMNPSTLSNSLPTWATAFCCVNLTGAAGLFMRPC